MVRIPDENGGVQMKGSVRLSTGIWLFAFCIGLVSPLRAQETAQPVASRLAGAVSAHAESDRLWGIEFYGGPSWPQVHLTGTGVLPAQQFFFTRFGETGRRVPSWYFGDGAALLNTVLTDAGLGLRLASLDSVLTSAIGDHRGAGTAGVRLSRSINTRIEAEFAFDYTRGTTGITSTTQQRIEASRTSFLSVFTAVLGGSDAFGVSSIAPVPDPQTTHHMRITAAANVTMFQVSKKTRAYVTLGAGLQTRAASTLTATLVGHYQFFPADFAPFSETDSVLVRYTEEDGRFVGVLGGGAKHFMTRRAGVRLDVRAYLSANRASTVVDATPTVAVVPFRQSASTSTATNPNIQFSNNEAATGEPSTLSGKTLGFQTFSATGVRREVAVTLGVFWRF